MSEQGFFPAPEVYVDGQAYFDACAEGRLLIKRCGDCEEKHFYPRALCPFCFSANTEWVESSGKGVIYTYSIMRVAKEPYAIGYVTLAEGVTMLTNFVDCDIEQIRIGQEVKVVFKPTKDGPPVPMFTPT